MQTLAVLSLAGGMGRTTTIVQLADRLQIHGRVLVLDLDPQASTTRQLKGHALNGSESSILEVLAGSLAPAEALHLISPLLSLLPADRGLGLHTKQLPPYAQEMLLRHKLQLLGSAFDFCLIDTPSAKSVYTAMACVAATQILIPVEVSAKGLISLEESLMFWQELDASGLAPGNLLGVLPIREPWVGQRRLRSTLELLHKMAQITNIPQFPAIPESRRLQTLHYPETLYQTVLGRFLSPQPLTEPAAHD